MRPEEVTIQPGVTLLEEFNILKAGANLIWPPNGSTWMLRPEYDDRLYENQLPGNLRLYYNRTGDVPNVNIRLYPFKNPIEKPDLVNITLRPGYTIEKQGKIIFQNPEIWDTMSFILDGLQKRVEWYMERKTPK